jgi:hypothetical protein
MTTKAEKQTHTENTFITQHELCRKSFRAKINVENAMKNEFKTT